jgi:Macro domain
MRNDEDVRTCFVIMPFGTKKDPEHKDKVQFDRLYKTIIKRAVLKDLRKRGIRMRCVRSDEIERAGLIHERMVKHIAEADVAVVDITTQNPNVYYELGVRHALRDRVTVLIRRKGKPNPFNIGGMTTIEYEPGDRRSAARTREAIANFVANGLLSSTKDSLVYTVLPGLRASLDPKPITESELEEYEIPDVPGKYIGIVRGNLRHANLGATLRRRPIHIWVNSENVNMQMARPYDKSVSALIRYLGAKRDDTGAILEDSIANELRAKMRRRQLVNPGEVVSTGAGSLKDTHKVRRIYHAASVYGVVGEGYNGIANIEHCITNALARVDWEARGLVDSKDKPKAATGTQAANSILFPLLSAGTARADVILNAKRQLATAISYLRSRAEFTRVKRVYFLAGDETVLAALRVALAELEVIRPNARRKKANGSVKHDAATRAKRKRATRRARA